MQGAAAQTSAKSDRRSVRRPGRGPGLTAWGALLLVVPLLLVSVSAEGQGRSKPRRLEVGARALSPAVPTARRVDLRHMPRRPRWRRGDSIRYIPKRAYLSDKHRSHQRRVKAPTGVEDPLAGLQRSFPQQRAFDEIELNQDGLGFSGATPPDPVLDVGPSYVIQAINTTSGSSFSIYEKTQGILVSGPLSMQGLAGVNSDCATGAGDPVVLYDEMAGRWLLSEFSDFGNKLCVYISISGDPVQGGWYAYEFEAPSFPDYPKFSVWHDGYYVGTNEYPSPALYVFDRQSMLLGQSATAQRFTIPSLSGFAFQMLTPADHDGSLPPPADSPAYFIRHRDDESHNPGGPNPSNDFLEIYEVSVDWSNSGLSELAGPTQVVMAEFDSNLCGLLSFSCVAQPSGGTPLDPLREVVMWRPQYRNMGSYELIVGSHVTDANGLDRAGIRWWELRKAGGGPWTLHQEGTYSPDDISRWMSSIATDKFGNMALGYSVSSAFISPGIRYTGRLSTDPAGVMSQPETVIAAGLGEQSMDRWGDYSSLNVDPTDGCTFWYTNEYVASANGSWGTKIASFKFDDCLTGTVSLTGSRLNQSICAPGDLSPMEIEVVGLGGFSDDVTLTLTGLPTGFTASFSSNVVSPGDSSVLQLSVDNTVPAGTYTISVVASAPEVSDVILEATVDVYEDPPTWAASTLTSPANSSTVDTSTPTFTWESVPQTDTYTLEIDDDPNFGSIDYTWTGTETSHKMVWGLSGNIIYSWRVRVDNPCGSEESNDWTFDVSLPTRYCQTSNLSIPDGVGIPVNDWMEINDADTILDLEVEVVVDHTYVGDLEVGLTHLSTLTSAQLIDRPGVPGSEYGCDSDDINVLLSDEATNSVENECEMVAPAITGTAMPQEPLSAFDGEDINGMWQLSVTDNESADEGQLVSWCLQPRMAPEPGAGVMLMSGILMMAAERALRRRARDRKQSGADPS